MKLTALYECLCDETRLRIVNALLSGALCVNELQEILGEPQVKISKHLHYLKARGLVTVRKVANWRVYSLPEKPSPALTAHLACLRECADGDACLRKDAPSLAAFREQQAARENHPLRRVAKVTVIAKKRAAKTTASPRAVSQKKSSDGDGSFLITPETEFPL